MQSSTYIKSSRIANCSKLKREIVIQALASELSKFGTGMYQKVLLGQQTHLNPLS